MSLWNTVSTSARNLGGMAANETKKAKLSMDNILLDRSIDSQKRSFGIAMYDYLVPLSEHQNFYAADDELTQIIRPLLILAQKEVRALAVKRVKQKEELAQAEVSRAAAAASPNNEATDSVSVGQKIATFGKVSYLHGGEAKIKTELAVTDRLIKGHKEDFGVSLFDALAKAEDEDGFLPNDRQIRNMYDKVREDIIVLLDQKKEKESEIRRLGERNANNVNSIPAY